ncbi:APC family permease [Jatrophihabitans sp.]|uniref:APC family permease n=1 Tax=Jatrophihabitans sp. TaxID=1932789 RepID=UPI002BE017E9|nr:amino acid permease [Jatrophihabitans sp.]
MSSDRGQRERQARPAGIGLTRRQAIPLAIGSVAGSGILFLPSAVYVAAGRNSLLVWILATLLCLPMLLMFEDMVRSHPDGRGIEAFIRHGLGDAVARCVPVLFLALVIIGLPAGALVAGRYVGNALEAGRPAEVVAAIVVLLAALASNLFGVKTNTRLQGATTWALVAMATVLLIFALPTARSGLHMLSPDLGNPGPVLPAVVLAFWTFAGFENLTFLSREFRRPERDFLPVSAIALGAYGLFTILLTVAIAVRVNRADVDQVAGLLQLAGTIRPHRLVTYCVTAIALFAMTLNAVAWIWGVSRLVAEAATHQILPAGLARTTAKGVPRRAVLLLAALFAVSTAVLVGYPGLLVDAVATASAIFLLMYLLSIVSYVRIRGLTLRSAANLLLLVVMVVSLFQSGWRAVYGVAVLAVALAVQLVRRRRLASAASAS